MTNSGGECAQLHDTKTQAGFYELFGVQASYHEMQVAGALIKGLVTKTFSNVEHGGITLTLFLAEERRVEEVETLLAQMKIFPWLEEGDGGGSCFIVDNEREIARLAFFGIEPDEVEYTLQQDDEGQIRGEFVSEYSVVHSCETYTGCYTYTDAITYVQEEPLPFKVRRSLLLEAKSNSEKMRRSLYMSLGLVVSVVDRVVSKVNSFDREELFRVGMEGLYYGLIHLEDRETSPDGYLLSCVEARIRRHVRNAKNLSV